MGNTSIESVVITPAPPIAIGAKITVSGYLRAVGISQFPSAGGWVLSLKTPCCPQQLASSGEVTTSVPAGNTNTLAFTGDLILPTSTAWPPGDYEVEIKFTGDLTNGLDPARYSQGINVGGEPGETSVIPRPGPCMPCTDPIETVNRVIRDGTVSAAVSELLQGAADTGFSSFSKPAGPNVLKALTSLSKAFAGKDAVRAKGECCGAQILMQIALESASPLEAELLKPGEPKLMKTKLSKAQANDATEVLRQVELLKPELLRLIRPQVVNANSELAATNLTYTPEGILISDVEVPESGEVMIAFPEEIAEGAELSREYYSTSPGGSEFQHYRNVGIAEYTKVNKVSGQTDQSDVNPSENTNAKLQKRDPDEAGALLKTPYFQPIVRNGLRTSMIFFLKPPAAQVRCFSWLDGEGAGCLQGKQYISCTAITVMQGDTLISCNATGDSGCTGFRLKPGWYTFSAPECVAIEGCNYMLASSSPVSAFLGAGQGCSDIFFRYKKKGNEIQVISQIYYPEASNPYVEANNNFAGMQYLLVSESDPTFLPQQQVTADGAAFSYRNLPAGSYLLLCQAPATYGAQPVQPVYPKGGRLALTIFSGQTSAVPVLVRFRTCTTAPAVLNGYVRDDTGAPIPAQLVKFVNNAGCVVGAAITDSNGVYTFQLYQAEDVMVVFGSQQFAVSKAQMQAAMKTVGTPALPSPGKTIERAVQRSELVAGFGD
jgi:hypothetical protein